MERLDESSCLLRGGELGPSLKLCEIWALRVAWFTAMIFCRYAQVVILYPSVFDPRSVAAGPANMSTVMMQQ
jgi:hypothetical protein